jgi:hypothetical protein
MIGSYHGIFECYSLGSTTSNHTVFEQYHRFILFHLKRHHLRDNILTTTHKDMFTEYGTCVGHNLNLRTETIQGIELKYAALFYMFKLSVYGLQNLEISHAIILQT